MLDGSIWQMVMSFQMLVSQFIIFVGGIGYDFLVIMGVNNNEYFGIQLLISFVFSMLIYVVIGVIFNYGIVGIICYDNVLFSGNVMLDILLFVFEFQIYVLMFGGMVVVGFLVCCCCVI